MELGGIVLLAVSVDIQLQILSAYYIRQREVYESRADGLWCATKYLMDQMYRSTRWMLALLSSRSDHIVTEGKGIRIVWASTIPTVRISFALNDTYIYIYIYIYLQNNGRMKTSMDIEFTAALTSEIVYAHQLCKQCGITIVLEYVHSCATWKLS